MLRIFSLLLIFFGFTFSVNADDWRPTVKEADWVQLTSGEWLRGDIKAFYNRTLEFDSKKLNLLEIDWEDIQYLESHISSIARIENHGVATGKIQLSGDTIKIINDEQTLEFNRDELISFITGEIKESNYWSGKISLGVNVRSGNTDQKDYTAKANIKRRTSKTRLILDYAGNYSVVKSVETINNHRFNFSLDYFKTRHFFYKPIFGEYFRDPFQNLDGKLTIGSGIGYTIVDDHKTEWSISTGPAYLYTQYSSALPDESQSESNPSLSFSTDYETEYSKTLDILAKYSLQVSNKESGGLTHRAELTLENEITGSFDLDISLILDRIGSPRANSDGTLPEKNDYKIVISVGYDF